MSSDDKISREEARFFVFAATIIPLARMIYAGSVNPETITREQFWVVLQGLGESRESAFEVHATFVEREMVLVSHCLSAGSPGSAIVLLFTLIESELNSLIRVHLGVMGFGSKTISEALKGTDFDTKLDVLLPLLGVSVPVRLRNTALQCRSIRNLVVHYKANPSLLSTEGDKEGDEEIAEGRAVKFFAGNPLPRIQRDLEHFYHQGVHASSVIRSAIDLFARYYDA